MIWALVLMTVLCVSIVATGAAVSRRVLRAQERERQAWVAERGELLNRIMYLSDRPWIMPEVPEAPPDDWDRPALVWPEQEPEEE